MWWKHENDETQSRDSPLNILSFNFEYVCHSSLYFFNHLIIPHVFILFDNFPWKIENISRAELMENFRRFVCLSSFLDSFMVGRFTNFTLKKLYLLIEENVHNFLSWKTRNKMKKKLFIRKKERFHSIPKDINNIPESGKKRTQKIRNENFYVTHEINGWAFLMENEWKYFIKLFSTLKLLFYYYIVQIFPFPAVTKKFFNISTRFFYCAWEKFRGEKEFFLGLKI